MTINVTTTGHRVLLEAMQAAVRSLHLYTDEGELTEHGYQAKVISPGAWDGNQYPMQTWEFDAGERVQVLGYFVSDAEGVVLWSREFPVKEGSEMDYVIEHKGDRIQVTLVFGLLVGNQ